MSGQTYFDLRKFMRGHWKNSLDLAAFLSGHGYGLPEYTVRQWWNRGSIPGKHLGLLIFLVQEDPTRQPSLRKFVKAA